MAKKKKVNHHNSLKDILGFDMFQNEKFNFFLGLVFLQCQNLLFLHNLSHLIQGFLVLYPYEQYYFYVLLLMQMQFLQAYLDTAILRFVQWN